MIDTIVTRRRALFFAGIFVGGVSAPAVAADHGAREQANVKLVSDFLKTWGDSDATGAKLATFMSDDCEFRSEDKAPLTGQAAVTSAFDGYLAKGVRYNIKVLDTFAKGPIVTNFRNEYSVSNGKSSETPFAVIGVFVIRNGKIREWRNFGLQNGQVGHQ